MIDATRTTSTLLDALRDPARSDAWRELDARYRPILMALARRAGLSEADAADAVQEALTDFFRSYRENRYDRSRGRLRQWLIGIARLKFADVRRAHARPGGAGAAPLETSLPESATDADWSSAWEAEQRASILAGALEQLRASEKIAEHTLKAFELAALQNVPAAEVAEQLGLTPQEVYLAKSRCLERVRAIIKRLEAEYEG